MEHLHCKAGGFKFKKKLADHKIVIGSATGLFIGNHNFVTGGIDHNIVYRVDHTTELFMFLNLIGKKNEANGDGILSQNGSPFFNCCCYI